MSNNLGGKGGGGEETGAEEASGGYGGIPKNRGGIGGERGYLLIKCDISASANYLAAGII